MSKTLAAEIASRTLEVTNPANRAIALGASLRRHGFEPVAAGGRGVPTDRTALVEWLLSTYRPAE